MSGKRIEYASNGGTANGHLATPEGGGNGRGILVLQEWWGLTEHVEDIVERFAGEGYAALAPDLWDGEKTSAPDQAEKLFMALNIDDASKKMAGGLAALREQGGVGGPLGVIGFCMGGQLALYAACERPDEIGAVVDFYGVHPKVEPDFSRLRAPVLGVFGDDDAFVPPDAVRALAEAVRAAGGSIETHSYAADHAFFNDTRPEVYREEHAKDAWRKTLDFFGSRLG